MAIRPNCSYRSSLDVRDWGDLADEVRNGVPEGSFWPLLGARRSGKTWALRGIEHVLGRDVARYVDLSTDKLPDDRKQSVLLLDEPGLHLFHEAADADARELRIKEVSALKFLDWCETRKREHNTRIVIAMCPAEWEAFCALKPRHGEGSVKPIDLLRPLTPLSTEQIEQLASADRALWLADVPLTWQQHPYLLLWLLAMGEHDSELRKDICAWRRATIDELNTDASVRYCHHVIHRGLSQAQHEVLRDIVAGSPVDVSVTACSVLKKAGLIREQDGACELVDPVVCDYFRPPLRIHHVSDIHVGHKTAFTVDAKVKGTAGKHLAEGAGQGPVRESYTTFLARLPPHRRPHLLIVSGDIAERATAEEYAEAKEWLAETTKQLVDHPDLADGEPRVLLVGGNHDVDWEQTAGEEGLRKRHQPFADAFPDHPRPKLEEAPDGRALAVISYEEAAIEVALLGSAELGGELDSELIGFIDKMRGKLTSKQLEEDADALKKRLGRYDPGLVHADELKRIRTHKWRRGAVRIAVLHHPVTMLPSMPEIAMLGGLLNAGQVKDALMDRRFSLVLHGHMHHPFVAVERWPKHDNHPLWIASAATLGSYNLYEAHGFNEITVYREGDDLQLEVCCYRRDGDTWIADERNRLGPALVATS